jgi:ATP/maltotriose-dependent transcriptional regulator MalT
VVIGAAGWGKTTAVAAWSRGRSSAWLGYDDYEGSTDRLLTRLFEVFRVHVSAPTPIKGAAALTDQLEPCVEALCVWLRSALSRDLILVLDDLHEL